MNKIGRKLKQIRLDFGYTQEWMAQQLGLSSSASGLRKIENGRTRHVKSKYVKKATELFNMTEQEIEDYAPNGIHQHNALQKEDTGLVSHHNMTDAERQSFLSMMDSYKSIIKELNEERRKDKELIHDLMMQLHSDK